MSELMQFEYVAVAVGVLVLILLYLAYRFLASSRWVLGWIQGNAGLSLLLLCGFLGLAITDIRTYQPMFDDRPIGTISVHTLGPGSHQLRFVNSKGIEQSYSLAGDRYRQVIRQFRWGVRYAGMGMGHGYRLDHLVVTSLDGGKKMEVPISNSGEVDVWQFYRDHLPGGFFFTAEWVETAPRTVVDGAMYELIPQAFDITVTPLNQVAKDAEKVVVPGEIPAADASTNPVSTTAAPVPAVPENLSTPAATPSVSPASPEAAAPPAESALTKGKIIRTPSPEEMPGAHLQATPATVVEKPANQ